MAYVFINTLQASAYKFFVQAPFQTSPADISYKGLITNLSSSQFI